MAKDIIFRLKAERVIKQINRSAKVISTFGANVPGTQFGIDLNRYQEFLVVTGKASEEEHVVHPVTGGVVHDPDSIDMEEATILWPTRINVPAQSNLIELQVESFGGSFRVYKGDILSLDTVRDPGHRHITYTLVFGVVISPSPREWHGYGSN